MGGGTRANDLFCRLQLGKRKEQQEHTLFNDLRRKATNGTEKETAFLWPLLLFQNEV